ncbi:MAG: hypothetical protein JWP74_2090 [Marmoricola sp.]|nr:hypothetical protein [Marmoricola sp.]
MRSRLVLLASLLFASVAFVPGAAQAATGFTLSPTSLAFGSVQLGSTKQLILTVKNTSTVNQSYAIAVPPGTAFSNFLPSGELSSECGSPSTYLVVAPKSSCALHVVFTPNAAGAATATLAVTAYAATGAAGTSTSTLGAPGATTAVKATGTGVSAKVTAAPSSIAFSRVLVSTELDKTTVLKNGSTVSLVFVPTFPTASGYTAIANDTDATSCYKSSQSLVVGPGQSCTLHVGFAPKSATALNATLNVAGHLSTAAAGTYSGDTSGSLAAAVAVKLTGTGTAPTYTATPKSLAFGAVTNNGSKELDTVVKNTSTIPLYLKPVFSDSHYDLPVLATGNTTDCVVRTAAHRTGLRLDPGSSCTLRVLFSPTAGVAPKASIALDAYRAPASGAPYVDAQDLGLKVASVPVALTGTGIGPKITASPTKYAFGKVTLTETNATNLTITNSSNIALFFRPSLPANSPYSLFQVPTTSDCLVKSDAGVVTGVRIEPGASCYLWVLYAPTAAVSSPQNLTVNAFAAPPGVQVDSGRNLGGAVNSLAIALTGTGVAPAFTIAPASLAFGTVKHGVTKTITETLTNTSDIPLQFAVSLSGDAAYTLAPAGAGGCVSTDGKGLNVDAKGKCTVSVTFAPTASGKPTGTLTVTAREGKGQVGAYQKYSPTVLNTKTSAITGTGS